MKTKEVYWVHSEIQLENKININKFRIDCSTGDCNFVLSERTSQANVPQDLDLQCFSASSFIHLTSHYR